MPLHEHVYCVVVAFKMTEWVEQKLCNKFCAKLDHSSVETIWMIQKAAAMGNWWLAASSWQHAHSCISCRVFWQNIKLPRLLSPRTDLAPQNFWVFPKLKSPLKGKRVQTINDIQENMIGQWVVIGGTVWGPKVPTLMETEASLFYVQCFLYLVSSSINVSICHIVWLDIFRTAYT